MTTILAVIFVLGLLILVHELGHFMAARSVGVSVIRFSLGFPPRILSFTPTGQGWLFRLYFFKKGENGKPAWGPVYEKVITSAVSKPTETEYCMAIVPLGGYLRVAGVIDEGLDETLTGAPDELNSKNRLEQGWFMSAGVIMNILLAVFLFAGITYTTGVAEVTDEPVVMEVQPSFPAQEIGLIAGDRIISIDGESIETWRELSDIIHGKPMEEISLRWERDGEVLSASVTTRESQIAAGDKVEKVGMIGISGGYEIRQAGVVESLSSGAVRTGFWFAVIVKSLKMIVTGEASMKDIGGPILIAQLAGQSAQAGIVALLSFTAIISVNLAFINILPVPGLDGGHILLLLIEGIARRKISVKARMIIQQAGMAMLLLLILVVIYNDITRLFTQ
ncbi:MAG: RIP metalloprotease RseP [Candidatus Marinimicrobia bacterium]|jgi:regulator of sigma E protease|nr:RIP metalloprotease RseP [Candidatus Neomarinimicrobiota bacterium]MDP6594063.1 RIP metalloprotease RseP [Candidatus Neomarinimicrobiota bacterium]MDP6836548.1 RIP metalloprotease RseP [Candidatus Neomarinimicrobiota bacterium]MDP6967086.1 RIP metalloprotease RseP [Candidatus Neomarinimicrobiota bacterium]|tara:strand:- start:719 stop:1894 length:1176 start_codon:yes stop_codon:yes gene_type:complete